MNRDKDINELGFLYEEMILTESLEPKYPTNLEIKTTPNGPNRSIITYKFITSQNNEVKVIFIEEFDNEQNSFVAIMFTVNDNLSSNRTERDIEILPNVIGILIRHIDKYDIVYFSAFRDDRDDQRGKNRRLNIYTKLINKYSSSTWNTEIDSHGEFYLRKNRQTTT